MGIIWVIVLHLTILRFVDNFVICGFFCFIFYMCVWYLCMCVYMFICVWVHVPGGCMCTCVCMGVEARGWLQVSSLITLHLTYWDKVPHLNQSSQICLREPQSLPAGTASGLPPSPSIYIGTGIFTPDLTLVRQASLSTLTTESSLSPSFGNFEKVGHRKLEILCFYNIPQSFTTPIM